jgi:hypothetical protein
VVTDARLEARFQILMLAPASLTFSREIIAA